MEGARPYLAHRHRELQAMVDAACKEWAGAHAEADGGGCVRLYVYAALLSRDGVLLQRRDRPRGTWGFFGGGAEIWRASLRRELRADAARGAAAELARELREECGASFLGACGPPLFAAAARYDVGRHAPWPALNVLFIVEVDPRVRPRLCGETRDARFFPPRELPRTFLRAHRPLLPALPDYTH